MSENEILKLVINNTKKVLPFLQNYEISLQSGFAEVGANSVDRSEIVILTLEDLHLKVPLVEVSGAATVGELVGKIHEKLA